MINQDKFDKLRKNISSMKPVGTIVSEVEEGNNDNTDFSINFDKIPIIPLRGIVPFQFLTLPLPIGRESTILLCRKAYEDNSAVLLVTQKDANELNSLKAELYEVGIIGKILKIFTLPDGSESAFVLCGHRAKLKSIDRTGEYLTGEIAPLPDSIPQQNDSKYDPLALSHTAIDVFMNFLDMLGDEETREIRFSVEQLDSVIKQINYICANAPIDIRQKNILLETTNYVKRVEKLLTYLDEAYQLMQMKVEIQKRTQSTLSRQQKEAFLQQQIRTIQNELGAAAEDDDISEFKQRAKHKLWNEETEKHFQKELQKMERYNTASPEYAIQYSYLDNFLNLPWEFYIPEHISIDRVEKKLNKDHYGLDKVKDRILEHISVLKLRGDLKAPILCLVGPPGVGKTSLGKSIADALGREYSRISLGGLHDEAEIRGHRRTYIGAMPGRIISALLKCNTGNPVIVLDEIDKIGNDFKGDPSSALLEVLDPEQNTKFHDNYLDCDYDLSKVLFIATANTLSTISAPLLDRMEVIDLSGYIVEEKVEIAKRHLIPKELELNGFEKKELTFKKDALEYLINNYTRESGVRQLEKTIASILRKLARKKASGKEYNKLIDKKTISELLGKERNTHEIYENNDFVGVVTGLAWTSVGGEILFIESSLSSGKGKLSITGNLGDVMKESATIALQYLKAHSENLKIDPKKFEENDVHIHVPEGAIPKDGPSAGITMVTSLASSFTDRKVKAKLAMTGEITLRGKVLPVGGIKEKILAAKRAGINEIVLSKDNIKDIEEINEKYIKGLEFHFVERVEEVLDLALL